MFTITVEGRFSIVVWDEPTMLRYARRYALNWGYDKVIVE